MFYYIVLFILIAIGLIAVLLFGLNKLLSFINFSQKRKIVIDYYFIRMMKELNPEKNFDFIMKEIRKELNKEMFNNN